MSSCKIVHKYEDRGHWGSRAEFLLSCVGYSVGLGNVWRFPFLAYENGGGAFLVPYIILLILVGKPLYFMEAALGQYGQVGPLQVWSEMLPGGVGVGVSMVIISMIVSIYYNVIMAYCLYYLFNSASTVLPWTVCDPEWSDARCYVRGEKNNIPVEESICIVDSVLGSCSEVTPQTSEEQFWRRKVLDVRESGLGDFCDIGEVKIDLAFYLMIAWIVVLACLSKGVKSSGKVVYFTATFPYIILLVLMVMGLTLPGADQGLYYLFVPEWEKLASFIVWRRAAGQVFFSLGISWGGIIMFGSYNQFRSKVHIDAHIISLIDFLTSLIASVVIFSTLGHSAQQLGVPVDQVVSGGQGLAFIAYPEALSHLPAPHFWSVIFFLMLFLLGLDSQFALFETVTCAVFDTFPSLRRNKMVVTSLMCMTCFIMGLPCVTQSGQYVLDLMDTYGASLSVMIIAVAEIVMVMWVYGVNTFCKDLKYMLGVAPGWYFKACWAVVSPLILVLIFLSACGEWELPAYGTLSYPAWAHTTGWVLTLVSVLQIPIWAVIMYLVYWVRGGSAFSPPQAWVDRRADASTNSTFIYKPDQSSFIVNEYFITDTKTFDKDFVTDVSSFVPGMHGDVHPACLKNPPGYDKALSYSYFCED